MRLAIYEWNAWYQFMLVRMVPEAVRVPARLGERAQDLLERLPSAIDAFAFHLNLTNTKTLPAERSDFLDRTASHGVVVLNGGVTDISKKAVQSQCRSYGLPSATAELAGNPAELLIVKTDLNFGGHSERQLVPDEREAAGSPRVSPLLSDWTAYKVVRRDEVRPEWWDDPALTVERFIDNRLHRLYRVNFAGDRVVILRLTNPNRLKKIFSSTERLDIYCRIEALRAGRVAGVERSVGAAIAVYLERSGMDFGALEIISDDAGASYIIDVNSTCYAAILNVRILAYLRRGLFARVASRAAALGRHLRADWTGSLPTWTMLRQEASRIRHLYTTRRT
jgi:hypothetical protein